LEELVRAPKLDVERKEMALKNLAALVGEIVAAYEAFTNIEVDFGNTKPELLETARRALRDRIYEARDMLKSTPKAEETPFVTIKSSGTDRRK
jgi:hypothetical protein